MTVDFDAFRAMPWDQRVTLFNLMTPDEKATLVRAQVSRWLAAHRDELGPAQIQILEENLAFINPELYQRPRSGEMTRRMKDLEARALALLSRDQAREALTMHWDSSCRVLPKSKGETDP